jgi:hypothetical protein
MLEPIITFWCTPEGLGGLYLYIWADKGVLNLSPMPVLLC